MQVEFNKAVNGDGETTRQRTQHNRALSPVVRSCRRKTTREKQNHECQHNGSANQPSIGQHLQVIVVRLFDALRAGRPHFDTLSMGMSDDFELAIAMGATMVRIGTLLFGPRA